MTGKIIYQGNLRTKNLHIKSGAEIITDAPVDNHGKGEAFSPTDLVAIAAANCMLTVAGIRAEKNGFSLEHSHADVSKVMSSDPRLIASLTIHVHFPAHLEESERKLCEFVSLNCPVVLSLHPDMQKEVSFHYDV